MSEYIALICGCGNVSGLSDKTIDIAEFLRCEIEEGWREIRERGEDDAPAPADLPTPPPGAEKFEFIGLCPQCADCIRTFRTHRADETPLAITGAPKKS